VEPAAPARRYTGIIREVLQQKWNTPQGRENKWGLRRARVSSFWRSLQPSFLPGLAIPGCELFTPCACGLVIGLENRLSAHYNTR
jgi:hypothetical protein